MKIKFLTFLTIGTLLLIFFYFVEYNFNFCIGDTFYVVSYFFIPLLVIIVSTAIYFVKFLICKLKK